MTVSLKLTLLAAVLAPIPAVSTASPLPPSAEQHVAKAKAAAGSEYGAVVPALCPGQGPPANIRVDSSKIETWYEPPAKVFDNLFFVGERDVSAWAIKTSGGIVLIDSLYEYSVQPEIIEGLKKLGLDPASIRYVIVTHGHRDHFGGAKFLQDRGARIMMSEVDWGMVEAAKGVKPVRDLAVSGPRKLTVGGTTIDIVPTPGHTPGTISVIFPVRDSGRTHVAAIWGGTGFNSRTEGQFRSYAASATMFMDATRKAGVDVALSNHPIVDSTFAKIDRLEHRKAGDPNPFVTGWSSERNLLTMGAECANAQLAVLNKEKPAIGHRN